MDSTEPTQKIVLHHRRRESVPLFKCPKVGDRTVSWAEFFSKQVLEPAGRSRRRANAGDVLHPFDWKAAKAFKNSDPHHSACIEAKVQSAVAHGFKKDSVAKALDPLCATSFQDVFTAVAEDFWLVGNGFIEVVREGGKIAGLHHVQAECVRIRVEDQKTLDYHFIVKVESGPELVCAAFGDAERVASKLAAQLKAQGGDVSELIHFRRPSSMHRWYGMPDWLGAVAQIELAHAISQYNYDFFLNSGVPEFILALIGHDLGKDWDEKVIPAIQSGTGMGNAHKTLALNIPKSKNDVELVVHKLGEEMSEGWFESMLDTVASRIVSAHRVPPLLAGILIPGKLGANNEFINAMWMFHSLVVAPAQKILQSTLANTLGTPEGVPGLSGEAAFELKTIVEEVPVAQVEAPGSMNEPAKTPGGRKDVPGSSLESKVDKALTDLPEEQRERILGNFFSGIIKGLVKPHSAA